MSAAANSLSLCRQPSAQVGIVRTGRENRGRRLLVLAIKTGVAVVIRTRDNADWLSRSHQTKHRNGIGRRNTTLQWRALATDVAGSADVIVCRAPISTVGYWYLTSLNIAQMISDIVTD